MADLNALIAQGVQFKAPPDPFAQYAQMQQLQQGQQANQLNQMQMQKYQREMEETNALRRLDPSSATYLQDVKRISPEKGFAFGKLQQEAAAAKLKQEVDTSTLVDSKLKQSRQLLDNITTPEQYLAWHEANHSDSVLGPLLASRGITAQSARAQIDKALSQPGGFEQMLNQSKLGVEKFAEMNKPHWVDTGAGLKPVSSLTGQPSVGVATIPKTATPGELLTAKTAKAGQDITLRGQNLLNQRAIENLAQNKIPTGYRAVAGGGVEPIPGGPASGDKPLTESQGNATAYGMRMQEANKTLTDLEKRGETDTGVISGVVGGVAGMVPLIGDKLQGATGSLFNALPGIMGGLSADQQQVVQSRINFITAQLRKESGASIAPSEFATAEKLYFPKPGDTQAVIDAKAKTRKTAIEAMKVQAGPGSKHISTGGGSTTATDPLGLR